MERQIKKDNPNAPVPPQLLDWKPNPEYMERSHPLRQILNANALVILSPSKQLFYNQAGLTEQTIPHYEQMLTAQGGFMRVIMGMMVHEMFHVKEGEDQVNDLSKRRKVNENRKAIIENLKQDAYLRSLMATYVKIVFSIGDQLKTKATSAEIDLLSDLGAIITEIKTKSPETWKFIWNYEYTEGFAEYVSAYSMIQVGVTSFSAQIDFQKEDKSNNFAYRSGAIGGLYLVNRLQVMPFANQEDHAESIWEIVLRLNKTPVSKSSIDSIQTKYADVPGVDGENEVKRVIDYLISTVMEIN